MRDPGVLVLELDLERVFRPGRSRSSCSYLMPLALMTTTFGLAEPLGAAEAEPEPLGAGAFDGAGA